MKNKAFTLAEIMIVLSVIGILTAILLPSAINSVPDENVMKFKKANSTLGAVIRELVNSDKYYKDGDLGIKPNGDLIDGTHDGDYTYFCKSLAENLTVKELNCSENPTNAGGYIDFSGPSASLINQKQWLDTDCKIAVGHAQAEITLPNKIVIYQSEPRMLFGISAKQLYNLYCTDASGQVDASNEFCNDLSWVEEKRAFKDIKDEDGFVATYKTLCIDVDGIGNGEDPFGYGIRLDGKIISGARADEWMNK